jgi:dTDP-4-dehydrorhamnose 3,5-epimerase-like enzyme
MKVTITSKELKNDGGIDGMVWSLFEDAKVSSMSPKKQIKLFKKKYNGTLKGGHYSNKQNNNEWNTADAEIEFESESDYVMFMLEWS